MTVHALKDILARLPFLNKVEREEVRGRLDVLTVSPTTAVGEVHQWISHALGNKGFPPLPVIMKSSQAKHFRRGAETLESFIREVFGLVATRTRQRLMLLLIQCALSELKDSGRRISPSTVATALADIWAIVERRFPGYLECGLLAEALADGGAKWDH